MSFNAGTVEGKLALNTKDFVAAIQRANKALDKIEKNSKDAAKGMTGFRDKLALARDLVLVLPAAFKAVTAPIKGFINFLKDASSAAAEFQDVASKLQTSLALQGVADPGAFTNELKEFASGLQDVTAFSETATLGVAQTLAIMGVNEKQIKTATKAVLDYSAATGRNAVESAKQFAKTLGGTLGELAETFPALKALSKEALMNGEAFAFAAKTMGGFAEAVANTSAALRTRFVNAWVDVKEEIGGILNPILDEFVIFGRKALEAITKSLQDKGLQQSLTQWLAGVANKVATAMLSLFDSALNLPTILAKLRVSLTEFFFGIRTHILETKLEFLAFGEEARGTLLSVFEALDGLPWLDMTESIDLLKAAMAESADAASDVRVALWDVEQAQAAAVEKAWQGVEAAGKLVQQYKEGHGVVGEVRDGLVDLVKTTGDWANGTEEVKNGLIQTVGVISKVGAEYKSALDARQARLQAILDAEQDSLTNQQAIGGAIEDNITKLGRQASAQGNVARATAATAAAAGAPGGHAARQAAHDKDFADFTPSAGASRRKGGSAGFDTSSIAGLKQAIQAANFAGTASTDKFARRNAAHLGRQFRAKLSALYEEQAKAFTAGLVEELNRAGIFDPVQRQQLIQQQLDEAKRLGIVQASGTGGFLR